jgi:hypothetical protein
VNEEQSLSRTLFKRCMRDSRLYKVMVDAIPAGTTAFKRCMRDSRLYKGSCYAWVL